MGFILYTCDDRLPVTLCQPRGDQQQSVVLGIDGEEVLFRYKDYQDGDQWKTMHMPGVEFIRRFLLHVLPKGMRHIRRFGFMGPRVVVGCVKLAGETAAAQKCRNTVTASAGTPECGWR